MIASGDFSDFGFSNEMVTMHDTAYKAISSVDGGWEFMRTYTPEEGLGFMFSEPPPLLIQINEAINSLYDAHSGMSYGEIMRQMEFIAKKGWLKFVSAVSERQNRNIAKNSWEDFISEVAERQKLKVAAAEL